jgi:hypothetical protein
VTSALIGLLGVLLGVAGTVGFAWWSRRDERRQRARVAARLMLGEASALRAQLAQARQEQQPIPDLRQRCNVLLYAWRQRPEELAEFPMEVWRSVTFWVHDLTNVAQHVERLGPSWSDEADWVYGRIEVVLTLADQLLAAAAATSSRFARFQRLLP